ncbi:MAG: PQQ-dependent sugar dehydrogenase [Fibrobacteria bacterium]
MNYVNPILILALSLSAVAAQAQTLPTGVNVEPFYDVNKAGVSFKVDKQSVAGIYEVPGKPQHFVVIGSLGYLWTLYPTDPTKAGTPGVIDYKKSQVGDFNNWVMKGHEEFVNAGAFDPNFKENRYFYVLYNKYGSPSDYHTGTTTTGADVWSNKNHLVVVDRWQMSADFATMKRDTTIISMDHGAGYGASSMVFGKDGYMYISPMSYSINSWDSTNFMRKVLRIDVSKSEGGRMYTIPKDNPWINSTNPAVKKEVFAFGFRNLYVLQADHITGSIWGAEVGEGAWEEINIIKSGLNYGWASGGDYASPFQGPGIEGPCDKNTSAGQAVVGSLKSPYKCSGAACLGRDFTCADFTNGPWNLTHDGKDMGGSKTAVQGLTSKCIVVSPAFRGDPSSPFYGYHFISDVGAKYFLAVKEGVDGAQNVGKVNVSGLSFTGDASHNGLTSFGEDSYGNMYVTFLSSTEKGPVQWHDIYRISHAQMKPLATPRATTLQSVRGPADRLFSLLALGHGASWLRLPEGSSGAELYDLGGRRIWQGKGVPGASLALPQGLVTGTAWVRYLP